MYGLYTIKCFKYQLYDVKCLYYIMLISNNIVQQNRTKLEEQVLLNYIKVFNTSDNIFVIKCKVDAT